MALLLLSGGCWRLALLEAVSCGWVAPVALWLLSGGCLVPVWRLAAGCLVPVWLLSGGWLGASLVALSCGCLAAYLATD